MTALCSSETRYQFGANGAVCSGAQPSFVFGEMVIIPDSRGLQGREGTGTWCHVDISRNSTLKLQCDVEQVFGRAPSWLYLQVLRVCLALRESLYHTSVLLSSHVTGLTSLATRCAIWGAFAKLQKKKKATISSGMSVRLSSRREQLNSCSTDFHEKYVMVSRMKHQLDATLCRFYFCRVTLHVSGASAHHREYLKLVQRPLVHVLSLQVSHHISLLGDVMQIVAGKSSHHLIRAVLGP